MDAAALGLKRIREQQFVMEDLADPVTVELVTSTQHKVSLKKVIDWMAHAGGTSPKEIAMMAGRGRGDRKANSSSERDGWRTTETTRR